MSRTMQDPQLTPHKGRVLLRPLIFNDVTKFEWHAFSSENRLETRVVRNETRKSFSVVNSGIHSYSTFR
jgi:hypothetical protein